MPLSFSATRDLLASLGHQPKRFLGREGGEGVLDGVALEKMEPHGKIGVSG